MGQFKYLPVELQDTEVQQSGCSAVLAELLGACSVYLRSILQGASHVQSISVCAKQFSSMATSTRGATLQYMFSLMM